MATRPRNDTYRLRLTRSGSRYTGCWSLNGGNWRRLGSVTNARLAAGTDYGVVALGPGRRGAPPYAAFASASAPRRSAAAGSLAWLWGSRLTWRATIPSTAVLCLTIVLAAGIPGMVGPVVLITAAAAWLVLLGRMSDNEARHVAALARAQGRPLSGSRVRRLLFPWWARAILMLGVLAVTVAAISASESDGLVILVLVFGVAVSWLIEQAVIALRSRALESELAACLSAGMRTTFQASPTRSSSQISQPPGSISVRRSPWNAEVGNA